MRRIFKYTILWLVLVSGCGKNDSGSSVANAGNGLSGKTFQSECLPIFTIGLKALLTYSDSESTFEVISYKNPLCTGPVEKSTITSKYSLGVAVEGLDRTSNIDDELISHVITLLTDENVGEANKDSRYGYTDWAKNIAKNVAGRAEEPSSAPEDAVGTKTYTIIKIESDQITLGDTEAEGRSGKTESERPNALGLIFKAK